MRERARFAVAIVDLIVRLRFEKWVKQIYFIQFKIEQGKERGTESESVRHNKNGNTKRKKKNREKDRKTLKKKKITGASNFHVDALTEMIIIALLKIGHRISACYTLGCGGVNFHPMEKSLSSGCCLMMMQIGVNALEVIAAVHIQTQTHHTNN